jgi:hypothetical protein
MSPIDPADFRALVDQLANALQSALLLAGKLATDSRATASDADHVYSAIGRAEAALRRLRGAKNEER